MGPIAPFNLLARYLSPVAKPLTAIVVEAYESGDYAADGCSGPRKEV